MASARNDSRIKKVKKAILTDQMRRTGTCYCQRCGWESKYARTEGASFASSVLDFHHIHPIRDADTYKGSDINGMENCHILCRSCHKTFHEVAEKDGVDYTTFFNATSSPIDQRRRYFNSDRRESLRKTTVNV